MGLLGNIFGKDKGYPPLEPSNPAARNLEGQKSEVESFVGSVKDKLELIPTRETVYIFVGKPPSAFGVAWLEDGKVHNFKTLMSEKSLSPQSVQTLSDKLRDAYKKHQDEARFSAVIAGQRVTVTPSEAFASDVDQVIHQV